MSDTPGNKAHSSAGHHAEQIVREFITTRPRRPREGRKVAGVAAALGQRYAVDPVLIRIAFVISAV
ncbi:MAG: PspC domain-containing protein, partial [Sciscionella sp.]